MVRLLQGGVIRLTRILVVPLQLTALVNALTATYANSKQYNGCNPIKAGWVREAFGEFRAFLIRPRWRVLVIPVAMLKTVLFLYSYAIHNICIIHKYLTPQLPACL